MERELTCDTADGPSEAFCFYSWHSAAERREFRQVWEGISDLQRHVLTTLTFTTGRPLLEMMEELPELTAPIILTRTIADAELSRRLARI